MTPPVTGESAAPFSPTQPPTQLRLASSGCVVGQERGFRCLPVIPGSPWCAKHHPERGAENRQHARLAARASHARRQDPALEAWAATLASSNAETREQALREAAVLVAKRVLTAAEGHAIVALSREADRRARVAKPASPSRVVVEVQQVSA